MTTTTIKPKSGYYGVKNIYDDGVLVGEFNFTKGMDSRNTRGEVRWCGGAVVDLSGYAFYADVCRHIRAGSLRGNTAA